VTSFDPPAVPWHDAPFIPLATLCDYVDCARLYAMRTDADRVLQGVVTELENEAFLRAAEERVLELDGGRS
jgi:hypothetical protein